MISVSPSWGARSVNYFTEFRRGATTSLQVFGTIYLVALAGFAVFGIAMAAIGAWPWLSVTIPGWQYETAPGVILHIVLAGAAVALLFYLPAARKVMALDHAHRRFQVTMEDVTKAYYIAHSEDRSGIFTMSSEFDAVRERMMYLKDHPSLATLEPDIIDVAAQMSTVSRDLAEVYSDAKVTRARTVLRQRQNEIMDLQDRIVQARKITDELKRWNSQVSVEESIADAQLSQLCEDLEEILPELLESRTAPKPMRAKPKKLATVTPLKTETAPMAAKAGE